MIEKIIQSWKPKFKYVVKAIEESKDLSVVSIEEPVVSLHDETEPKD